MPARAMALVAAVAMGLVAGCASTGPIQGQLAIPGQAAPDRVQMTYVTDRFDEGGTLSVTLPTGERFSGRFVQITSTTAVESVGPTWASWGPVWSEWGPFGESWVSGPNDVITFRRNYTGKVVATLFGDRGNMIRCWFKLANPPGGMRDGGAGECQLSTGGTINASF